MYISWRGLDSKCYSFDPPYIANVKMKTIELLIDDRLLGPNGILPKREQYDVNIHYEHQKLKSLSTKSGFQSKYGAVTFGQYRRKYHLTNFEVLRRRNKRNNPCLDGPYDEQAIQYAVTTIGCKSSLLEIGNEKKLCDTLEDFKKLHLQLISNDQPHPCTQIQSMNEWQEEKLVLNSTSFEFRTLRVSNSTTLVIEINFLDDFYKEFIYLKAYTLESLIGNAGGYIGKYNVMF